MRALVLQSDFGISDGAVSAMYGVAHSVDPKINIFDLTHDIPPFNIWEASYRLLQTVSYWPAGTVFVSVVDPGVGSSRRSIVARTENNHYIITPDNGTLSHLKEEIAEVRLLEEEKNRLPNSGESYTFHGRDIYAYTGARLASECIQFNEVGPLVSLDTVVQLPLQEAYIEGAHLHGIIEIHDIRFGNLWTNIRRSFVNKFNIHYGDFVEITICREEEVLFKEKVIFGRSFADSKVGEPICYINSLNNLGIAINQKSMAANYKIGTGVDWKVQIRLIT
ncbi:S-adenosyl-l-methionine hydroxide adenosyltransferase family protein [Niallia alba]|uniref:S-adenosyl-l-methionine hydroxide adenosyltransferase family protein n=1 Tax=Niallia circulans TaxID=1397 RepID=A0A941GGF2_NIACI|nr:MULTISPECIES: S-adenosyl-l-methionine hydroxide adenosyltransferase family protein [Niallia]MCB5236988.1 S-adenosyl-l-methionine hydroxide adenosyltransferase family protein [Niallia circulans]MED3793026.1 S-adenosyl-l-methionine hydroxide adenosyltransferase family protein [Niallia alba]